MSKWSDHRLQVPITEARTCKGCGKTYNIEWHGDAATKADWLACPNCGTVLASWDAPVYATIFNEQSGPVKSEGA